MWLLIPAIVLLIFSIFLSTYLTSREEKARYQHLLFSLRYKIFLFCVTCVLFITAMILMFISAGWKWGLAGLGISWLVVLGVNLGITTSYGVRGHLRFLQTDKLNKTTYEPSKYEILNEILLTEGKNLLSKHFKHPELLGRSTYISVDPINQSDYAYFISSFLASRIGHSNTEKFESIFKKLLQDDYDKYYEAAKQRIITEYNKSSTG